MGKRVAFAAAGLAAVVLASQAWAWRYKELDDQLFSDSRQYTTAGWDASFRHFAIIRCSGPSDIQVAYTVPQEVTDEGTRKLESMGAKMTVLIEGVNNDDPEHIDTKFQRAPDGRLTMIGYGERLIALLPRIVYSGGILGFSLDIPDRDEWSFPAMMEGMAADHILWMVKGCRIDVDISEQSPAAKESRDRQLRKRKQ